MKINLGHAGHIYLIALIYIITAISISSAGNPSDSVTVYFRTGQSLFDGTYADNAASMENFIEDLRLSAATVDSVIVRGSVSPEGHNIDDPLSRKRCEAVAKHIITHSDINPELVSTRPAGIDWALLRHLIATTPDVPSRESLIKIIDTCPEWVYDAKGNIIDGRNKRLRQVAGGAPYRWIQARLFPKLRMAVAVTLKREEHPAISEVSEIPNFPEVSEVPEVPEVPNVSEVSETSGTSEVSETIVLQATPKPLFMAVKTNMLYDAALVPNLAAEFYVGKDLSVYGDWMYAWWDSNRRHKYWRIYGGDLGMRWWFGSKAHEKPLTGHHLGIFAGIVTFDFELGDHGYMGGKPGGTLWDRCLVNSGIEYGYSLPVSSRINIDFSIALGFLGGNYIKYFPFDNEYFKDREYKMRFVGPTKAEVSLVWLIGRGNVNNRKGGTR